MIEAVLATALTLSDISADDLSYSFVNEERMPLVISPREQAISVDDLVEFAKKNPAVFQSLLKTYGAILIRDFSVEDAEDFANIVTTILQSELLDYLAGEGSRKRVIPGVYTSTEAPPEFKIPLHNELTCTDHPCRYICFYCDVAPNTGTGQTILGSTETVTQMLVQHPNAWSLFDDKTLRYTSRHPPEGSFIGKVNVTHKTWQDSFHTDDKEVVARICKEKGFECHWNDDWLEITRRAPAICGPDDYFDHPYWYNQAHLYHANPRIRGGWVNHILASLLYTIPSTRQYDIAFDDGSEIPTSVVYEIYDVMDAATIKFDWQKGDVLILDNRRALHGRAPCEGQRRILTCMVQ